MTVAAFIIVFVSVSNVQKINNESNAYIRVINCIVSYTATTRKQSDIERCYVSVEKQMNVKLQRYDNSH